jgi:hypothetical protein
MKIKAGVITFHRAQNYGAVLQSYALAEYLKSVECDVEVIDYYPKVFREEYASFPKTTFRRASLLGKIHTFLKYICNLPYTIKRNKVFADFIHRNMSLSSVQFDDKNYQIVGYDVIFFGSDQIWNPKLTGGFDIVFTGNFKKGNSRFVSYAASTLMNSETMEMKDYIQAYRSILKRFDMVSTREQDFTEYLNKFNIKTVEQVIDPVLLLDRYRWGLIAEHPNIEHYLLLYSVPENPLITKKAKDVANIKGLVFVEISSNGRLYVDGKYKQIVSPEQYVGYFQNANFIMTSSFHGTAFSVIFRKPFVFLLKGNSYDGRAYSFLKKIDMTDRAITLETKILPTDNVYSETFEESWINMKTESERFISKALELNI